MEKETIRKEQKILEKLMKKEEERLKPWEKETKHGKRIEGKVMSFQQWQEEKLKTELMLIFPPMMKNQRDVLKFMRTMIVCLFLKSSFFSE